MSRAPAAAAVVALLAAALAPAAPARPALAPTAPVVMVLFDELPLVSLLGRNGRIDAARYPGFARLARGSTWYSNATTVSDATMLATPAILDGRTPRRGAPPTAATHPRNVFTLLRARGYRIRSQEEATSLCPYRSCRRRRGARYYLARDRIVRFRRWIAGIDTRRSRALYVKQALLPHVPWVFLPTGQRYDRTVLGPIPGLNSSEISVFDRTLVRQSWQRHLIQVGTADRLVSELLDRLRATGVYDRATVVVMADHGVSFRVGATDRRTVVAANAGDIAPVPLFIKAPRQRGGRIDRSLVRSYDVLPTIARLIGLPLPRGVNGRAAGSRPVRRRARVKVLSRAAIGSITLSRGGLTAVRSRALRRKLALFGAGPRSLFATGPNQRLLGRPLSSLRVLGRRRLRATLNESRAYTRIDPTNPFVPIHVTGRIFGGAPGSRRDVAVAVNGRVRGVSRSVRLRGVASEYYSVLLAPAALVPGRNTIEVLAVGRRARGGTPLRRMYPRSAPSQLASGWK